MKVTTLIKLTIVCFAILAATNIYFSHMAERAKYELIYAYDTRHAFTLAGLFLRGASSNLTSYARSYVTTGDEFYRGEFWAEYQADRAGRGQQTFFTHNSPREELEILERVMYYFNALRYMDFAAVETRTQYGYEAASRLAFSPEYAAYEEALSEALDELNTAVVSRMRELIVGAQNAVARSLFIVRVATYIFAAGTIFTTAYILHAVKTALRLQREAEKKTILAQHDLSEMQAQKRAEIAEESNRAKTRFLARMSHEIRTPITTMLGVSEIRLRNPVLLSPESQEAFAKINEAANTLLTIVNDILDFSKIESGTVEIVIAEYEVASLVSDVAQLHMVYLEHKNIAFRMNVDENLPAMLLGDAIRIRQFINNLLTNAFKYTVEGEVTLGLTLEDSHMPGCVTLLVTVRDTGIGMSPEQLKILGSGVDFTRFHERENPHISGTGLGIPIIYALAQMMSAEINITSEVGKGTEILVRIPQKTVGDTLLGKETARNLESFEYSRKEHQNIDFTPEPMPYGKVLVVDDVEANLFVARGLLSFYRLQVDECTNGHDAVERIRRGDVYDVIFMDHMMPGMNGIDTMRAIRKLNYNHPIVALTANAIIGQREEFIDCGFDDFMSKPIENSLLNEVLNRYIRDKQPPEILEATKTMSAATGIQSFQHTTEMRQTLQADFAKNHKNSFAEMTEALNAGDLETAHRLAHNIKSITGMIGEREVTKHAREIEHILRNGKHPAPQQMQALGEAFDAVLESIGPVGDHPPLLQKTYDKAKASELFRELRPLLEARSIDALALVPRLRELPETEIIAKQIENIDFAPALKNLDTLQGILEV